VNVSNAYANAPLRYSINVTLEGCCDAREVIADEDLHRDHRNHPPAKSTWSAIEEIDRS
jgi:hypothetical protein